MSRTVTALDLGGSHVVAGRVDIGAGTVARGPRVLLPDGASRADLLDAIVGAAREVLDGSHLACAVPGPFDYAGGICWLGHKLEPLYGVDVGAALAAGLDLPRDAISFLNDADAFLLGESWKGAAAGHRRAVGVTVGTGLGSAFLADGRIVSVDATVPPSGEIHLLEYRARPVEETISRRALIERYGDASLDVEDLAELARGGDSRARAAFAEAGTALGEVLAPWLRSFASSCLVVGGSIARAWDLFEGGLHDSLEDVTTLEAIRPAALLDDAALLGAAMGSTGILFRGPRATDAQVTAWRSARLAAGARPVHGLSVAEARADQAAEQVVRTTEGAGVETVDLDGPVPIRLYRPPGADPAPVCVWFPGGGWVLDTLPSAEPMCRHVASAAPCAVAGVRYRLAPEHPFPAPLDDVVATVRWLVETAADHGLDPSRVVVGGASAGANLAAALTLVARGSDDLDLAAQVLVYPALAREAAIRVSHPDADEAFFGADDMEWCWSHYLARDEDASNPLAVPLLADDLEGLPPALVITAQLDPLRDEGELYAGRLRAAGVPVECVRFGGVPHGFFSQGGVLDAADEAQLLVIEMLRRAFRLG